MNESTASKKYLLVLAVVLVATCISWIINGQAIIGVDDANIYMVYMKNLSEGHGFVYNAGCERVEGFTSLLWTLIGAVFFMFSRFPELWLLIFNILVVSYTLFRVVLHIDNHFSERRISNYSLLFLALLVALPGYFDWAVFSLMETGLWSSLLILTSLHVLERKSTHGNLKYYLKLAGLSFFLLLCRPEAMAWVPFFLVFSGIKEFFILEKARKTLLSTSAMILGFAGVLALLTLWRLQYFGYPLPNTFYAKISSSVGGNIVAGLIYIKNYLIQYPLISLGILVCFIFFTKKSLKSELGFMELFKVEFGALLIFAIFDLTMFVPLVTGGDHFGFARFIQPTVPLFLLMPLYVGIFEKIKLTKPLIIGFAVFAFFSSTYNLRDIYFFRKSPVRHEWIISAEGRQQSERLNKFFAHLPQLPRQGVLIAGGTAFSYDGITIDMLGLSNTQMAHAAKVINDKNLKNHASFNKEVFFMQKPDIFWLGGGFHHDGELKIRPDFKRLAEVAFQNIHLDPKFQEKYGYFLIERLETGEVLEVFASREFTSTLPAEIYFAKEINYE